MFILAVNHLLSLDSGFGEFPGFVAPLMHASRSRSSIVLIGHEKCMIHVTLYKSYCYV